MAWQHSAALVHALLDRERERGVPPARQLVAGFSQGGAMALHVALRYPERLAGLVALSSYLLFPERLAAERSQANADLPVFVGHGTQDPVVPHAMGAATAQQLQSMQQPVEFHSYPLPHSVSMEELADIGGFLARCGAGAVPGA